MIPSSSGGSGAPRRLLNFEPGDSSPSSTSSPPPGGRRQPTVEDESDAHDSPNTGGRSRHSLPLGESEDRINRFTFPYTFSKALTRCLTRVAA